MISTPETEREKSAIFLEEGLRRGDLFVKWYNNQIDEFGEADGQELYKWQQALSAEFIDTDCGTFVMATQTSNSETEAYYHFSIVVKPSGGGYYKSKEGMNEEQQETLDMYIDTFGLESI